MLEDQGFSDGRAGEGAAPFFLHFDHAEIEEGPMGHMLEDRYLRPPLARRDGRDAGDHALAGERSPAGGRPADATLTLASGRHAAPGPDRRRDGRQSGTAARAGIRRTGWGYGQTGAGLRGRHAFRTTAVGAPVLHAGGPLAILPLPGNRSSIVWTEGDRPRRTTFNALDDAAYLDVLRPRFGDFRGDISLAGKALCLSG